MKKWVVILTAVLLVCMAAGFYLFQENFVIINGNAISREVTQLDLRGTKAPDADTLARFSGLKRLDLRDTGITIQQYHLLEQALPGCEIFWSVPFQGQHYPNTSADLRLTQLAREDIALLAYFPQLAQVDATDCTDLAAIQALREAYPQLSVSYRVPLDGKKLLPDTTALTLGGGTTEDLAMALSCLPLVRDVNASGCHDYAALHALQTQYPQCAFRYQVSIGNQEVENSVAALTVSNPDISLLEARLPYLPQLQAVTLTGLLPANEELHRLQEAYPHISFIWDFTLFGLNVSTQDSIIDLSNIPMESTQEVETALGYFNNLERVIMCNCGISNEEMDALCKRNPDIRFVWTVSIGPDIRLRTDAKYLMPHQYGTKLEDSQTANLKYCIDLECIDLGHSSVSDVSFLAYMPHMKYLLLADTKVSDISAVAGMQELVFVELFITKVQDFSPLLSCPNLEDLNISYTRPNDISVLCQMTWLKTLLMKGWKNPEGEAQIRAALPNTHLAFAFEEDDSSTGNGWRKLPNYYKMRDLLGMKYLDQD